MGLFGKKKEPRHAEPVQAQNAGTEPETLTTDTGYVLKLDKNGEFIVGNDRDLLEVQYELAAIDEAEYQARLREYNRTGKINWSAS